LTRKLTKIRRELGDLQNYANSLDASLGLEYSRAAKRCLQILEKLKEDPDAEAFYRSRRLDFPAVEKPLQLSLVQLYWFFRHECGCSGHESEVRVAIIVNEVLPTPESRKLKYIPEYKDAESQGCSAVRLAVSRY
jgi:hypothetical protein